MTTQGYMSTFARDVAQGKRDPGQLTEEELNDARGEAVGKLKAWLLWPSRRDPSLEEERKNQASNDWLERVTLLTDKQCAAE